MKGVGYFLLVSCLLIAACDSGDVEAVFNSEKMALQKELKLEKETRIRLQSYIDSVMRQDTMAVMRRVKNYETYIIPSSSTSPSTTAQKSTPQATPSTPSPSFSQARNSMDRWMANQAPPSSQMRVPTAGRIVLSFPYKALFNSEQNKISDKGAKVLASLTNVFRSQQMEHLTVETHVDSLSSSKAGGWNEGWSQAQKIGNVLISQGFPSAKLALASHGSTAPVSTNSTEAGRYLNRRTLFILEVQ